MLAIRPIEVAYGALCVKSSIPAIRMRLRRWSWGVWLAADLEESRAWAIYHERQKRIRFIDRQPRTDRAA
jgi:hypothetical protein